MRDDFTKYFYITAVLILGLLFLNVLPGLMGNTVSRHRLEMVVKEMHNGDLNREDLDALAASYYEGLRQDNKQSGLPIEIEDIRLTNDFLRYEFKPNLKSHYAAGMRVTNSLGMPNPEYTYQKPPHTRRIAWLGDSISVGPYGHDYVALLEERLNQANLTPDTQRYQILNFSVYGYGIVQMMDAALERAPKFQPDVYMVALTQLEANRKGGWGSHITSLVLNGVDLKYDFLRRVVAQAGIQPADHTATIARKLEPHFLEVTRWALDQIRDHAASQGAQMVIILVPAPIDPDIIAEEFDEIRPTIDSVGVPVIDLRDAFRSMKLYDLQVRPREDVHPNERGHEILFENLYRKILQDPKFSADLLGPTGAKSAQKTSLDPQPNKPTELRPDPNKISSVREQDRP
jgi:hypothetical protein